MLPNETEFKQVGVLPGEHVKMSFDENSLGFLADVLINLYSDKEMAVIREYSTNARDSHRAAGVTKPIEVTTPSYLSYFFKVKDYGVGMSKDDIVKIYSKYGASTKRNTNDQTGMLGLGCKSALTYTDQFTITAVKDGVKVNVAVSRAVDGGGSMTILSETQTMEPNGVEIVIPTARNNGFESKCNRFFQYWEKGTVLVNGREPDQADIKKITDRVWIKNRSDNYDKPILVMGGVPYEINQDQIKVPSSVVFFADMGTVAFQPNREYLHYTPQTISTLKALYKEYELNLIKIIQQEIDSKPTKLDAISAYNNWVSKLYYDPIDLKPSDFTYQGKTLCLEFTFDYRWEPGRGLNEILLGYSLKNIKNDVIIHEFQGEKLTPYQKQKIKAWANSQGISPDRYLFCKTVPGDGWLDDVKQVDWQNILDTKIPRQPRGPKQPKPKPSYEIYTKGRYVSTRDFDTSQPMLYSTKGEWRELTGGGYKIDLAFPEVQFVFIGVNRLNKFLAAFPTAEPLRSGLKRLVENYIQNLTDQQKVYLRSDSYEVSKYSNIDSSKIKDADLVDIIAAGDTSKEVANMQRIWDQLCSMGWDLNIHNMNDMFTKQSQSSWVSIRYPLLSSLISHAPYKASQDYWDHVYLYLNTAYDKYKKGV